MTDAPGKLPLTFLPRADVRLLSRVRPLVGLQVRALRVDPVAVGMMAPVKLRSSGALAELGRLELQAATDT